MALINEITRLRDNSLSSLDASHNYYAHTKTSWRLVQQMVREGHKFTIRNQATGNIVDETELSGLAQNYKKRAQPLNSTVGRLKIKKASKDITTYAVEIRVESEKSQTEYRKTRSIL